MRTKNSLNINENTLSHDQLLSLDILEQRAAIRANIYTGHTAGLGAAKLQANLAIIPEEFALHFMRFCQRNPKPYPVSGVSETGNPMMITLGEDIDIRSDMPCYNIYRDGLLAEQRQNLSQLWQEDYVSFALGCSFTFEHAAMHAGIRMWHIENNTTVPMFQTNIYCVPAGRFSGKMVVSMRAIPTHQVDQVIAISDRYPLAHGAPIHIGTPAEIGIPDINQPQWGDPAPVDDGHIPVFWACGVTPQNAMRNAHIPVVITHKPGCMLITDIDEYAKTPSSKIRERIMKKTLTIMAAALALSGTFVAADSPVVLKAVGTWSSLTNFKKHEGPFFNQRLAEASGGQIAGDKNPSPA